MEKDRYEQDKILFIIFMPCLLLSLSLFMFSLYIFFPLVLDWNYDIPSFVFTWREKLRLGYELSEPRAGLSVFTLFFIPALVIGFVVYLVGNRIENEVQGIKPAVHKVVKEDLKETSTFSLKLLLLLLAVMGMVFFLQWLLLRV